MSTPRQHVTASGGSGAAPGPHAGSPHDPVPLWNIANILTVGRIALVPVFLVLLFVGDGHDTAWRLAATGVFAIAAITDRIDGQLARKHGLVTDFGKLADPIADKASSVPRSSGCRCSATCRGGSPASSRLGSWVSLPCGSLCSGTP